MLNIESGDTVELNNGSSFVVKEHNSAPDLVWINNCWYHKDTGLLGSSEDDKECRFHVKRIISRNGIHYTESLLTCLI